GPGRLPRTDTGASLEDRLDLRQVLPAEVDVERPEVLREVLAALGSRDGHHVVALRHHPRERELTRSASLAARERTHLLDQLQVLLEILPLEAGGVAAEVVPGEGGRGAGRRGGEATGPRGVGDKA